MEEQVADVDIWVKTLFPLNTHVLADTRKAAKSQIIDAVNYKVLLMFGCFLLKRFLWGLWWHKLCSSIRFALTLAHTHVDERGPVSLVSGKNAKILAPNVAGPHVLN